MSKVILSMIYLKKIFSLNFGVDSDVSNEVFLGVRYDKSFFSILLFLERCCLLNDNYFSIICNHFQMQAFLDSCFVSFRRQVNVSSLQSVIETLLPWVEVLDYDVSFLVILSIFIF